MSAPPRWPSDDELSQLLAGNLHEGRQAEIEALLEQDEALRQRLDKLAGGGSWIGRAGGSAGSEPTSIHNDDFALQAAMDGLKHQASAATVMQGVERGSMVLNFLSPSDNPAALGKLGHYDVLELIGTGGFGLVLKAQDSKLNRLVAIKVLAPHLATHATARKRFTREAHAAAAVRHDHVVTIHAIDENERTPFLVMEYIEGLSLQQLIDQQGPLDVLQILRIGAQVAAGLAAAHKQGQIHRDIKPANILLENGVQRVKITDFGLARAADDASLTQSGVIAGTPMYMAPEQARGESVDFRADLFSLGGVMYTMCTGRPAFRADSAVAVLKRVCDDQPRPIRVVNPEVPDWLVGIIDRLMAKRRDERFQSAQEVSELLEQCLAHLQQPELTPLPAAASGYAKQVGTHVRSHSPSTGTPPVISDAQLEIADAQRRARGPGIGLIVVGILNLATLLFVMLSASFVAVRPMRAGEAHASPVLFIGMFTVVMFLFAGLGSALQIFAGVQLQRLRMWPLVVLAALFSILTLSVCGLGGGVGIWALIVLFDPRHQRAARLAAGERLPELPRKPLPDATLEAARQQVRWPALALTVVAILNVITLPIIGLVLLRTGEIATWLMLVILGEILVLSVFIALGAWSMRQLRYWPLAMIGATFAMLVGPGNVLGLFVGIWALVVLMRQEVRAAFARNSRAGELSATSTTPNSSLAVVLLVMMVCFVGAGVVLSSAGWFFSFSEAAPDQPVVMSELTIQYDMPNILVEVVGYGRAGNVNDRWYTPPETQSSGEQVRLYAAGDYDVRAFDASNVKIFEQHVSLYDGQSAKVVVLPQFYPSEQLTVWTDKGHFDRSQVVYSALSPDGKLAAWSLKSNHIVVAELKQGRELWRFMVDDPSVFAFSPDGKYIAALARDDHGEPAGEMAVGLHNIADQGVKFLKPTVTLEEERFQKLQDVKALAFAPDSARLLVASSYRIPKQIETDTQYKSIVRNWNVTTGQEEAPLAYQDGIVDHIVFPSGLNDVVAITSREADENGTLLSLWEMNKLQLIRDVHWPESTFDSIALTPQAGWVYAAYYDPIKQPGRAPGPYVSIYATRNHTGGRGLFLEPGKIHLQARTPAMAMSHDGKVFALCQDTQTIELYETNSLRPKKVGELRSNSYMLQPKLLFTPDNKQLLAIGMNPQVLKWDVTRFTTAGDGREAGAITPERPPLPTPPIETAEATATSEGVLPIKLHRKIVSPYAKGVARIVPLADGDQFITAGQGKDAQHLLRWNLPEDKVVHKYAEVAGDAVLTAATVSNGGTRLAIGTQTGDIMTWSLRNNAPEAMFVAHDGPIPPYGLRFHWNGKELLSGSRDTLFKVWKDGNGGSFTEDKNVAPIEFVEIVPGQDWYLFGGAEGKFKISWKVDDAEFSKEFDAGIAPVRTVVFHNDQRHFLTGDAQGNILYWNYDRNLQPMQKFVGHQGEITTLAIMPDGMHFVSAARDNTLRIWSLITGQEVARAEAPYVGAVAVLDAGKTLVSAAAQGSTIEKEAENALAVWQVPKLPASPDTSVIDLQIEQLRKEFELAQTRQGSGLISSEELGTIEMALLELRIKRAEGVGNRELTRYYLEDLLRIHRAAVDRAAKLKATGNVAQEYYDRVESAMKVVEARLKQATPTTTAEEEPMK